MSDPASAAVIASAGRLFGSLAAPAARKLAGHLTFRWRVSRRVRKRVDFSCSWRTYRLWLKGLTEEELAQSMESIHGTLAKRLDEQLSDISKEWRSAEDRLSRALRIVELTYPAIAATLGDAARTELSEMWAQQRSVAVRDQLMQISGPGASMSHYDHGVILRHRSEVRRSVRLQAFELGEKALASHFERISIPEVPSGELAVLLGDFGAGKSEAAEAWHRQEIRNLIESADAPFPLWLFARDLITGNLESEVDQQLGPKWRHGRGASIVIDGLDEIDPAAAQAVLESSRRLVGTYTNVSALLTVRPGILTLSKSEEVTLAPMSEHEALELVELVGDISRDTWRWTKDMRATVTRPFFALAAGALLGRDRAPRREADLIRELVEHALKRGQERSAITSQESRNVLTNLAIMLTRSGNDGLSFGDRQVARSSRLIAEDQDGSVRFSLPIFQHWFAAQSILDRDVPLHEVVKDAHSFDRWRWAAAVAALSAPNIEVLDNLIETWVAGNPGAASWILKEAFGKGQDRRSEEDEFLDVDTSGTRLLRALRTWTDSLGRFANGVLPLRVVRGPINLGVMVSGHHVSAAISTLRPANDSLTEFPPGSNLSTQTDPPEWLPWFSVLAPRGEAWPWTMVQSMIARETAERLSKDPFIGSANGVWAHERRFDVARRLLDRGSLYRDGLPVERVVARAKEVLAGAPEGRGATTSSSRPLSFSATELEELVAWLYASGIEVLESGLPGRDRDPTDAWVWNLYSTQRLIEFELEVYDRACEAYDEAMASTFDRLGWSMPSSGLSPFGVLLELRFDSRHRPNNIPGITVTRVPMDLLPSIAPSGTTAYWSSSGRAVAVEGNREKPHDWERHSATIGTIRSWLAERGRGHILGLGWTITTADDLANVRPASSIAAGWLFRDLKEIGLGDDAFPKLH